MFEADPVVAPSPSRHIAELIWRAPLVVVSLLFLLLVAGMALVGAPLLLDASAKINFSMRALPPFQLEHGLMFILGADSLGRSILARLAVGAQYTLFIALSAVGISFVIGVILGIWAGYRSGWQSMIIMRITDAIMSFPSLLLAILLLYILPDQSNTIIFVLAFSRIPLFLRVTRSEILEVRERQFVAAAKTMGLGTVRILYKHVLRPVLPTLMTVASMEIGFVMLSESSLSFIGLGVKAPQISWGLMVSQGTQYLSTSWWLAVMPGSAIVLTALALNISTSWLQLYIDPKQRWRTGA